MSLPAPPLESLDFGVVSLQRGAVLADYGNQGLERIKPPADLVLRFSGRLHAGRRRLAGAGDSLECLLVEHAHVTTEFFGMAVHVRADLGEPAVHVRLEQ